MHKSGNFFNSQKRLPEQLDQALLIHDFKRSSRDISLLQQLELRRIEFIFQV